MDLLKQTTQENNTTLVLVTHEPDYAAMARHEIFLVDGKVSTTRDLASQA